jgi:hypothetical protein
MCGHKHVCHGLAYPGIRLLRGGKKPGYLLCPLNSRCFQTLPETSWRDRSNMSNSDYPPDPEHDLEHPNRFPETNLQGPLHHSLPTKPVLLTISVYAIHAYLEISNFALVPLVYTTPIEFGGLGLDPARMATCLAALGIMTGVLPFFFFHRIVKFLGLRRALLMFMSGLVPAFLFFPINGTRARHVGVDLVTWILVLVHLFMMVGITMTYGMPLPFTHRPVMIYKRS